MVKAKTPVESLIKARGGTRGGKLRKGNEAGTGFTSTKQPTPEQKKAGWDLKRQAKQILDGIVAKENLSLSQMRKKYMVYIGDPKIPEDYRNDEMYKVKVDIPWKDRQAIMYAYRAMTTVTGNLDWMNRHVPMAPQKMEIEMPKDLDPASDVIADMDADDI